MRLISKQDAAELLGVTLATINNWCSEGLLNTHYLYTKSRTRAFLDRKTIESLIDDAQAIAESKRKIEAVRKKLADTEKDITFTAKLARLYNVNDARGLSYFQDICIAVLDVAKPMLKERDYLVLNSYIMGYSLKEIAVNYDITASRVSQIISKGCRVLYQIKDYASVVQQLNDVKYENRRLQGELMELKEKLSVQEEKNDYDKIIDMDIKDVDMSVRCKNVALAIGAKSLRELAMHKREEIAHLRNCGKKTMWDFDELFEQFGLTWKK